MVSGELSILATRYAIAALNTWKEPLTLDLCNSLEKLITFYEHNTVLLFALQLPIYTYEQKKEALVCARIAYMLPEELDGISDLLLVHQRIFLLPAVCKKLIEQSQKRRNMVRCLVITTIPLSVMQQKICADFIQKISMEMPIIRWLVDSSLIAGMRIQTKEWLWEYSVDAQLRLIANTVLN